MDLKILTLRDLGSLIQNYEQTNSEKEFEAVQAELIRRTQTKEKAEVLFDFSANAFKSNPNEENFCKLYALMICVKSWGCDEVKIGSCSRK